MLNQCWKKWATYLAGRRHSLRPIANVAIQALQMPDQLHPRPWAQGLATDEDELG